MGAGATDGGGPGAAAAASAAATDSGGKALSDVIENLPEILARKKAVETHTNILGALMAQIKARDVPTYFEVCPTYLISVYLDILC